MHLCTAAPCPWDLLPRPRDVVRHVPGRSGPRILWLSQPPLRNSELNWVSWNEIVGLLVRLLSHSAFLRLRLRWDDSCSACMQVALRDDGVRQFGGAKPGLSEVRAKLALRQQLAATTGVRAWLAQPDQACSSWQSESRLSSATACRNASVCKGQC